MIILSPTRLRTLNAVPITPEFDAHGRQVGRIASRNGSSLRPRPLLGFGTIFLVFYLGTQNSGFCQEDGDTGGVLASSMTDSFLNIDADDSCAAQTDTDGDGRRDCL